MTEASPGVCSTSEIDSLVGTSGCLLPNSKAKLINASGEEVIDYETRGNLLVQSPSVVLGYLNNERANSETFTWDDDGRWLMTGDEVIVRKSEQGNDHFVIVDRIKELIKVKVTDSKLICLYILTFLGSSGGSRRARGTSSHSPTGL